MIERITARALLLLLSATLVLPLRSAEPAKRDSVPALWSDAGQAAGTNCVRPIAPGPIDGRVAFLTAAMLEKNHYLRLPFDSALSSRFFDTYLDTLDPQHMHFTQGDIAEFEHYRTNLNRLTLGEGRVADVRPACEIYNRFFERLSQRTAYAEKLLNTEKFTFDSNERIVLNRKGQPFPQDLAAAKRIWRERLRFEYLQELLSKEAARKKKENMAAVKASGSTRTSLDSHPAGTPPAPGGAVASSTSTGTCPPGTILQMAAAAAKEQRSRLPLQSPKEAAQWKPAPAAAPGAAGAQAGPTPSAEAAAPLRAAGPAPRKTEAEEIVATLNHRYHRNLRFFEDWNNEDVLQIYLTALAHVYDPHSDYLGRQQLEGFAMQMNLSLFGIGAELTLSDDGYCTIRRLLPGGPAIKSNKLKENDRVVAVAQGDQAPVDIVDLSLNKAVQLIRGPKGTEVRLTIIPAGGSDADRRVISLVRDEIPLEEQAAKAKLIELPDFEGRKLRLGVIDLPSFYSTFDPVNTKDKPEQKSTTVDVARLLKKLKQEKVEGVVLDLRHNGGGSLEEAIKLTGLFIKTGPVVQIKEVDGTIQEADDTDPSVLYDGPLIVLTSRGSASASEIVAGALQDYGRALIVGDRSTHGKGTVQSVNQLRPYMRMMDSSVTNDPGALKLTIKKFYRPSGASTQLRGVVPDIILPSLANESKDVGESALENPLAWDEIPSAKYDHLNRVDPYLAELRRRSAERVASDKEYSYVREDVQRFIKQQADKTVSLNEQARLKESEDQQARNKARDNERRARPEPSEKVYELTLKLADEPGLPAPVPWTNTAVAAASPHPATSAGASTNSVAAAGTPIPAEDPEDAAEPPAPAFDAPLLEAEHILVDYIGLTSKETVATAGR
ncbi:MAG TPA: carboxy terminal-processing peptidase [Candidatus Acidoferrum sp.]|nr:carboxy terminal-processing peptidase [Candidatus Acidoferrum sp.]